MANPFTDKDGFPADIGGDCGDSINRAGQIACLTGRWPVHPMRYLLQDGFVRHPLQTPWNNPKNLTRDQIAPFVAGYWFTKRSDIFPPCFTVFLGGFFAPNVERDFPGTKKYPWPHRFINDKGQSETRLFDGPDIMTPDISFLVKACAGKISWFSMAFGWIFNDIAVRLLCKKKDPTDCDDWNTLCMAIAYGNLSALLYYKNNRKFGYLHSINYYWIERRGDHYMAELWSSFLKRL